MRLSCSGPACLCLKRSHETGEIPSVVFLYFFHKLSFVSETTNEYELPDRNQNGVPASEIIRIYNKPGTG